MYFLSQSAIDQESVKTVARNFDKSILGFTLIERSAPIRGRTDNIRINRKYFWTTYEVKVQVFNIMCEEPDCNGPVSDPVIIYSAEDMPQVAPTKVGARPHNSTAINITWNELPDVREKVSQEQSKLMAGK
jgi:hypothetical protein